MARVDNLENFLTDVAGAIREKKGTQDQIPAENFDTEIKSITSGLDTSDATATADDIINLKTAYADGVKIAGNLPDPETLYSAVSQLPNAANAGKGVIQSVFDISTEANFNFQNPYIATDKRFTFKTIGGINELPYSNVSIVIVQLNSQNFYAILFESSSMFITPRGGGWPCWYGGKANLIDSTVKVYHYQNNDWVLDTSKSQTISDNVARKTDYPDWSFKDVFGTDIYFSGKEGHNSFTNSVIGTSYEVFDYYSSESSSFYNKSFDVTDATPPNMSNLTLNEVVQRNIYNGLGVYYSDKTSWSKIASSSKDANATTSDILDGKTAYKNNVKITGTMPNNGELNYTPSTEEQTIPAGYTSGGTISALGTPDNSFADTNAEVYNKIQNQYENMQPRVLTNSDKTIDKNIYFIPVKKDGTPLLDTSQVTNMQNMFNSCSNLTTIPGLNTSNVTNMEYTFNRCTNLTTIPLLDTSQVTNMHDTFNRCTNLTTIPELNTSNVINMNYMFNGCTNLTTIPELDTSTATNMVNMFAGCSSLSDDSLNNIMQMCANATSYTRTKTLKDIGLTSEQADKCKTLSNYSAFTSAGWTTGY